MNIYSYNINGIRAAINKGLISWLKTESCDLICFQELKAEISQFNPADFTDIGYNPIWNSALRKGYSGVAILSKAKPTNYNIGIGVKKFDDEGRVITAFFDNFVQVAVYVPSGSMGDERQDFKMEFLSEFYNYISKLLKNNKNVIISGDFNICHKPIDINNPDKHIDVSGFLPEERNWLDKFLELGLIDSFRIFNHEAEQYSWWSYRQNSRMKNLGWRIDYNFVSENLKPKINNAKILQSIFHSDHCPVVVQL